METNDKLKETDFKSQTYFYDIFVLFQWHNKNRRFWFW